MLSQGLRLSSQIPKPETSDAKTLQVLSPTTGAISCELGSRSRVSGLLSGLLNDSSGRRWPLSIPAAAWEQTHFRAD